MIEIWHAVSPRICAAISAAQPVTVMLDTIRKMHDAVAKYRASVGILYHGFNTMPVRRIFGRRILS